MPSSRAKPAGPQRLAPPKTRPNQRENHCSRLAALPDTARQHGAGRQAQGRVGLTHATAPERLPRSARSHKREIRASDERPTVPTAHAPKTTTTMRLMFWALSSFLGGRTKMGHAIKHSAAVGTQGEGGKPCRAWWGATKHPSPGPPPKRWKTARWGTSDESEKMGEARAQGRRGALRRAGAAGACHGRRLRRHAALHAAHCLVLRTSLKSRAAPAPEGPG